MKPCEKWKIKLCTHMPLMDLDLEPGSNKQQLLTHQLVSRGRRHHFSYGFRYERLNMLTNGHNGQVIEIQTIWLMFMKRTHMRIVHYYAHIWIGKSEE